jgi:hypothetical protein
MSTARSTSVQHSELGERKKYGLPAFWVVTINVEYGGINHLANVRTI